MDRSISVLSFDGASPLTRAFLGLARTVYAGDRRWIPEFTARTRKAMSGRHPLAHLLSQRHFLALRGGRPIARASAFISRVVTMAGGPLGTIGRFEAFDDLESTTALLDEACSWLASSGVRAVWGPMEGSFWQPYRLMTEGCDDDPFYGEPYNKPYYAALFEAAGFVAFRRWSTHFIQLATLEAIARATKGRHEALLAAGYRFRPLERGQLGSDLAVLHRLVSDSFCDFPGFHALEPQVFMKLFGQFGPRSRPDLIKFLVDPGGREVGYLCVLPDPAAAIRVMQGRTDWLAMARAFLARDKPSLYVALYLGITGAEQRRRSHAGPAMAHEIAQAGLRDGVPVASALMADRSPARYWSGHLPHHEHHYALYQRSLGQVPPATIWSRRQELGSRIEVQP